MDCCLPGSFVHRISQTRILEWLPFPFPNYELSILHQLKFPVFPFYQQNRTAKGMVSWREMLMKAKLGLEVQLKPGLVFSQEFLGLTKNTDD